MMLRFREDKIRRLESRLAGSIPTDTFLREENKRLSEENQILQGKLDRNPEVTRFAVENIRLLDQLRRYVSFLTKTVTMKYSLLLAAPYNYLYRYQEFYEEGERDILLAEVSSLREQVFVLLEFNT